MTYSIEQRLTEALWTYHAAVQKRDGIEARIHRGDLDRLLLDRTLEAAERVVAARVALYRVLMDEGWQPPDVVAQDIAYDDEVLVLPADEPSLRR